MKAMLVYKRHLLPRCKPVEVRPGAIVRVLPQGKRAWRNHSEEDLFCIVIQANIESIDYSGQDNESSKRIPSFPSDTFVHRHAFVIFTCYPPSILDRRRRTPLPATPHTKLLILCTAAVAAVYAGAYVYTEPSAQAAGSAGSVTGTKAASRSTSNPNANTNAPASGKKTSPTSPSSGGSTQVKYKDGTYTGSGSNVYGDLSVAVTISRGKIAAVKITSYNMHYPQSYVDPQMNQEFVKMQTYRVYAVSGATASSYNFAEAVYYALQRARA